MSQIRLVTLSAYVYVRARTHACGTRGIVEMRIRITTLTGKVGEPADEAAAAVDPSQLHHVGLKSNSILVLVARARAYTRTRTLSFLYIVRVIKATLRREG